MAVALTLKTQVASDCFVSIEQEKPCSTKQLEQTLDTILTNPTFTRDMEAQRWRCLKDFHDSLKQSRQSYLPNEFITASTNFLKHWESSLIPITEKLQVLNLWLEPTRHFEHQPLPTTAQMALTLFETEGKQLSLSAYRTLINKAVANWLEHGKSSGSRTALSPAQQRFLTDSICYKLGIQERQPKGLSFRQRIDDYDRVEQDCLQRVRLWLNPYFFAHQLCNDAATCTDTSTSGTLLPPSLLSMFESPPAYEPKDTVPPKEVSNNNFQALHLMNALITKMSPEELVLVQLASEETLNKYDCTLVQILGCHFLRNVEGALEKVNVDRLANVSFEGHPNIAFIIACQLIDGATSLKEIVLLFEQHSELLTLPAHLLDCLKQRLVERLIELKSHYQLCIQSPYQWQNDLSLLKEINIQQAIIELTQEYYSEVIRNASSIDELCLGASKSIFCKPSCIYRLQQQRTESFKRSFSQRFTESPNLTEELLAALKKPYPKDLTDLLKTEYQQCLKQEVVKAENNQKLEQLLVTKVMPLANQPELQAACARLLLQEQHDLISKKKVALDDMLSWKQRMAIPCLKSQIQTNIQALVAVHAQQTNDIEGISQLVDYSAQYQHSLTSSQQAAITKLIQDRVNELLQANAVSIEECADWLSRLPLNQITLLGTGFNHPKFNLHRLLRLQALNALKESDPSLADPITLAQMPIEFLPACNETIKAKALLVAVEASYIKLTKRLVAAKACLDIKDDKDNNLLMISAQKGALELTQYLLSLAHFTPDSLNKEHENFLHKALAGKNPKIVALALGSANAKILEQRSKAGLRPLEKAILVDDAQCLAVLLASKPNTEIRKIGNSSNEQKGPLHIACEWKKSHSLQQLILQYPELIEQETSLGFTPLATAARYGNSDTVQKLVAAKAEINVKTSRNDTLIHLAAENTDSVDVFYYVWSLPFTQAQKQQQVRAQHALQVAIKTHHHQAFTQLLNSGLYQLSQVDSEGLNILQFTAKYGDDFTMRQVIALVGIGQGINDCATGKFSNQTAMDLANSTTKELLASKGAKTQAQILAERKRKQEEEERHRKYVANLEQENTNLQAKVRSLRNALDHAESRVSTAKLAMFAKGDGLLATMI